MATGTPCKKCKRDCIVPGLLVSPIGVIPPILIDARVMSDIQVETELFIDYIIDGIKNKSYCDGDVSTYCLDKIIDALLAKIGELVAAAVQSGTIIGKCYEMYIRKGVAITANCVCNDNDIANGNGPPSAEVKVVIDSIMLKDTDCGLST
jgi:hypothetical protein